jgi:hypothetical protein
MFITITITWRLRRQRLLKQLLRQAAVVHPLRLRQAAALRQAVAAVALRPAAPRSGELRL